MLSGFSRFPAVETWGFSLSPGLCRKAGPRGTRCRCGFDVALCKQRGPVDGVFKSLVTGRSGDWSVEVLRSPDAVQRLGADPSRLLDNRPLAGVDRSCQRAEGTVQLIPLRFQPGPRRRRVPLAAPRPKPKPSRVNHPLGNVSIVEEVMNRNNTASRIFPSSGYTIGAADALRPDLTMPPERVAGSGAVHHAAAQLPDHGGKRCCFSRHRPENINWPVIL